MLPASNKGPSLSFGFPDVCLTPVGPVIVPIPYPNFAAHAMACVFSPIVKVNMLPALNLASVIAMTTGDEPGVAHPTIKGIGTFVVGNPVVFIEGLPGIMLTALTMGNKMNCSVGSVITPGAPNVLYTLAPGIGASGEPNSGAESDRETTSDEGVEAEKDRQAHTVDPRLSGSPLSEKPVLLPEGVGVVRVRVFSLSLPGAIHLAVTRLVAVGMRALVIDLTGCPGGEFSALVAVASNFLPAGAHVVTLRDAEGDETPAFSAGGAWCTLPVIIAVDKSTASAAELFAAVLATHGRATVVGERTFGKGVARADTPDGTAAIAEVLLPDGSSLNGNGLTPHFSCAAKDAVKMAIGLAHPTRQS